MCKNEGWGEFEMSIDMYTTEKTKSTVYHDLNFQKPRYETIQTIQIKNPSQALLQILRETGPVASDDDPKAAKARKANDGKKRKPGYDFEKMAEGLTKLGEDDLLHVIQLIHDHKNEDTYTKNDMDAGEFSVDLFTLPDHLARMIWDVLVSFPTPSQRKVVLEPNADNPNSWNRSLLLRRTSLLSVLIEHLGNLGEARVFLRFSALYGAF